MPENVFRTLKKKVRREWVICFSAALFFGLLAHFYKLTNWLPNWDSLVFRHHSHNMTHLGRWLLGAANALSSYYELPWINGLLAIIYLSFSAVCISALFSLKRTVTLILTGALVVVFPTVTSTMMYAYTADGYCLAMLCASGAALLLARGGRKGMLAAVLLTTAACGIYQAYLTVLIMLLLLYLTDRLLFSEDSAGEIWRAAVRFLICGVVGLLLYGIAEKISLTVFQVELSDYQGIQRSLSILMGGSGEQVQEAVSGVGSANGQGGIFSLVGWALLTAIKNSLTRFWIFFFDFSQGLNLYSIWNILLFILLALFFIVAAARSRIWRSWQKSVLLLLCILAMPFGANILFFINPGIDYHNLMTMGYCVVYLALILFYERLEDGPEGLRVFKSWAILAFSMVLIYQFILVANVSYHTLQIAYEKSFGIAVRIADRIEQMPEAAECKKLAVIGGLPGSEAYSVAFPPDITGTTEGYILRESDPSIGQNVLLSMLEDYCGLSYESVTVEEQQELMLDPAVLNMGRWPESDSIIVMGDTLVIALGDTDHG